VRTRSRGRAKIFPTRRRLGNMGREVARKAHLYVASRRRRAPGQPLRGGTRRRRMGVDGVNLRYERTTGLVGKKGGPGI
jgi:hypothetical protein